MTKKTIIQSLAIIVTVIALQACNNADKNNKTENGSEAVKEIAHADYQCPMDCEKGKVYHEEGKCPVCGMDLAKVEHKESEKHDHDAKTEHKDGDGHDHKEGDGHKHTEGEKHEHKEGDGHNH